MKKVPPINELRKICIKKKKHPMYARLFARKIGLYFTWFLLHFNVTPNQATLMGLMISIAGSLCAIKGNHMYFIAAALLWQLSFIFDTVDGEIARYTKKSSPKGHYFDRISEYVSLSFMFVGITFGVYRMFNEVYYFIFGFAAVLAVLYFRMFTSEKYKIVYEYKLKLKEIRDKKKIQRGLLNYLKSIHDKVGFIFRFPALINVLTIAAFLNILNWALIFYGITLPFIAFGNFIYEIQVRFGKLE